MKKKKKKRYFRNNNRVFRIHRIQQNTFNDSIINQIDEENEVTISNRWTPLIDRADIRRGKVC